MNLPAISIVDTKETKNQDGQALSPLTPESQPTKIALSGQ